VLPEFPAFGIAEYRDAVRAGFGDPVITFFIGVLMLSAAFTLVRPRHTPDLSRAAARAARRTDRVLLGVLVVGTLISMWITDMAVARCCCRFGVGLLHDAGLRPGKSNFGRSLMIATAFGPPSAASPHRQAPRPTSWPSGSSNSSPAPMSFGDG
jgi:sodium-dependent dicarboxylate transporter 2/3/5